MRDGFARNGFSGRILIVHRGRSRLTPSAVLIGYPLRGRSKEPFTSKAEMAVIVDGDLLRINGQVLEFTTQIMQRG